MTYEKWKSMDAVPVWIVLSTVPAMGFTCAPVAPLPVGWPQVQPVVPGKLGPELILIMTDYQSMTVSQLKQLVKDSAAPRGTLSKLKRKQDLIHYLTQPLEQQQQQQEEDAGSEESEEDVVTTAAKIAADRNTERPNGADAGDVVRDRAKKKPKTKKGFDWRNSAAKKYLKKCFKEGVIPLTHPTDDGGDGPLAVWDTHCKDHPAFKGMEYNTTFSNRLRAVKNDSASKIKRAKVDKDNLEAFRAKHPVDATNARGLGELRWEGSAAEKFMKEDIEAILTLDDEVEIGKRLKPLVFHASRPEYFVFPLKTFRDHIYQEKRTRKFLSYSEAEKNKPNKNKVMEE